MELRQRRPLGILTFLGVAVLTITIIFGILAPGRAQAQSIPYKVNFQGRLTDNNGNILSDGLYNIKFRLYTVLSGGSASWQEDRVFGASDNRVQITNGLFNIQFGDLTALSPALFSGTFPLYLEVELPTPATATCASNGCASFTEGAMTPRQPLASSPYAFSADTLDGLDSTSFGQLSAANAWTGTNTLSKAGGVAVALTGTAASGGEQVQFGGVAALSGGSVNGTYLGGNPASYSGDFINFQINNVAKLKVDNTGNLTLGTGAVIAVGAASGTALSCTGGQFLQNQVVTGGVVTAGNCAPGAGAGTSLSNLTATSINQSLIANANNSLDLGAAGTVWNDLFVSNVDAGTTSTTLAIGAANATAITLGKFGVTTTMPGTLVINSGANVPTTDQATIDNTGSTGVVAAGVNGLSVKYKGGAAAVEAAGLRIDYQPGTTSGGTWSGLRIVAAATGAASGVTSYGLKLEGPTSAGTGQDTAIRIGTGWDIGADIQSGGLQLADALTDPNTPASGNLRVYSRLVAGRSMLSVKGSSGVSYALQPSFAQQNIFMVTPGSGTTATTLSTTGGYYALAGNTPGTPTSSEANGYLTSFATSAIAGNVIGLAGATNTYFRGSVANGADGFFFVTRITLNDATLTNYTSTTTGTRMFYGLSDQTSATMGASNSPTGNYVGFSFAANRSGEGGIMQFMSRDGTTETHVATGVTLAASKTYDLYLYVKPRDATIYWRIDNLTDGAAPVEGSKTTNLPTATAAMKPMDILANLSAAARTFGFQRLYVETDR